MSVHLERVGRVLDHLKDAGEVFRCVTRALAVIVGAAMVTVLSITACLWGLAWIYR